MARPRVQVPKKRERRPVKRFDVLQLDEKHLLGGKKTDKWRKVKEKSERNVAYRRQVKEAKMKRAEARRVAAEAKRRAVEAKKKRVAAQKEGAVAAKKKGAQAKNKK